MKYFRVASAAMGVGALVPSAVKAGFTGEGKALWWSITVTTLTSIVGEFVAPEKLWTLEKLRVKFNATWAVISEGE